MVDDEEIPSLIEHQNSVNHTSQSGNARVPLTIICGFLGAGKSTLLRRILTERHGYRIAVIMNEFADTADIEAKTINVSSPNDPTAEKSEEFLELANGCLCCSIKDTGVAAIEKLMERKGAFDHILLETTGLADPGPIASMFWQNEEFAMGLGRDITLDGVICVVDAVFGKDQMEEDRSSKENEIGESLRQIAGSDVILLNKIDLAAADTIEFTETLIRQVNPVASIYRTTRGEIDLKHIMGIRAFSSPPTFNQSERTPHHNHMHKHAGGDSCGEGCTENKPHYELRGFSSLQVVCPVLTPAQSERLDEWIRTVLWEGHTPDGSSSTELRILRCKGAFSLDSGEQYVLQGVRNMYEISKLENTDTTGVPEVGKIILIGQGLDDAIRRSLHDVFL